MSSNIVLSSYDLKQVLKHAAIICNSFNKGGCVYAAKSTSGIYSVIQT